MMVNSSSHKVAPLTNKIKDFYKDIANQFFVHENEELEENVRAWNILFSDESVAIKLAKEILKNE